jgi:hypothetical protein
VENNINATWWVVCNFFVVRGVLLPPPPPGPHLTLVTTLPADRGASAGAETGECHGGSRERLKRNCDPLHGGFGRIHTFRTGVAVCWLALQKVLCSKLCPVLCSGFRICQPLDNRYWYCLSTSSLRVRHTLSRQPHGTEVPMCSTSPVR